jgi:catechol 2,3-dioxygenase-like lactoylglutathione lyase family enzyme
MDALDAPRFHVRRVRYVKTLHTAFRVTDLVASLDFYFALGYEEVGRISFDDGTILTVLKFPGEEVATLELVHQPADGPVQIGSRLQPSRHPGRRTCHRPPDALAKGADARTGATASWAERPADLLAH